MPRTGPALLPGARVPVTQSAYTSPRWAERVGRCAEGRSVAWGVRGPLPGRGPFVEAGHPLGLGPWSLGEGRLRTGQVSLLFVLSADPCPSHVLTAESPYPKPGWRRGWLWLTCQSTAGSLAEGRVGGLLSAQCREAEGEMSPSRPCPRLPREPQDPVPFQSLT